MALVPEERMAQHVNRPVVYSRLLALPGARNVQDLNSMGLHKLLHFDLWLVISCALNVQTRFLVLSGKTLGSEGPATKFCGQRKDEGPVAIPDIPLGALKVIVGGAFSQLVLISNRTIFGSSALRAPASMREVEA